ncbi:metalloprotease [Coemansia interrupta]|uniref:Metalloprotease n=1 Tax=Coemansia interrupta TaxID=1126814 RepID=A0A9W8HJP1_9FUNG|nr:metalloprotease [Coemansia interrupta]
MTSHQSYNEFTGNIELSPNDKRKYRLLRLVNNMVVVCVQDVDAKQAAAVLSVNIGSYANPPEFLGLAHFLEHMLLRGSVKYPQENDFDEYISRSSGTKNASTAFHTTCYHFKIDNGALEGAMDRLSRFFIDPLMDPDCVDREINAVHSEYVSKLQNDGRREFIILKSAANPKQPFSQFPTGNIDTLKGSAKRLGLDLREELLKFHEKYYSADVMRLIVVGNHSLDQMTEWAVSMFTSVVSKGDTRPVVPFHPFGQNELGKVLRYESIGECNSITLVFALPEVRHLYKSNPFTYICSLLTRADKGSVLFYLKQKGIATAIGAVINDWSASHFNLLVVKVHATPLGIKRYNDVVHAVFAYLQMLVHEGPQQWYYDEIKTVSDANYRFSKQQNALDLRQLILNNIHNDYVWPEHIVYKGLPMVDFMPHLVTQYMSYLVPSNYLLVIQAKSHKDVECTNEEKYYGIKYNISDLPPCLTTDLVVDQQLASHFHMPMPNVYLPENLDVDKPDNLSAIATADEPTLLKLSDSIEIWFKRDDQFFVPRGSIKLRLSLSKTPDTLRLFAMTLLYARYVDDYLSQKLFSATKANLSLDVVQDHTSVFVCVSGFSDKLPAFLLDIVRHLKAIKLDEQLFDIHKKKLQDGYTNMVYQRALSQAAGHMRYANGDLALHYSTVARVVDVLTIDDIQVLADSIFDKTFVKMSMVGNFTENDALATAQSLETILDYEPLPRELRLTYLYYRFSPGYYVFQSPLPDIDCKDNAIMLQIQCNVGYDKYQNCLRQIVMGILKQPFFYQLRTKEQLGYIVYAGGHRDEQAKGSITLQIQSDSNPFYLAMRIDCFLRNFRQVLVDYDDSKLATKIKTLAEAWSEKHKSIQEEANAFWSPISNGDYDFNFNRGCVGLLEKVTKADLIEFWDRHINPETAPQYTRVDYQMWSSKTPQPTAAEMSTYLPGVIALAGCIRQAGFDGISVAAVANVVSGATANDTTDMLLCRIKELGQDRSDIDVLFAKISDAKSNVRVALEMAIAEAKLPFEHLTENHACFATAGMQRLSNGSWLLTDIAAFKSTQPLSGETIPVRRLIPKYTNKISCL